MAQFGVPPQPPADAYYGQYESTALVPQYEYAPVPQYGAAPVPQYGAAPVPQYEYAPVPQYGGSLPPPKRIGKGKVPRYTASQKAAMPPEERFRVEREEKKMAEFQRLERVRQQQARQKIQDMKNFVARMVFAQVFFAVCMVVLMSGGYWCTNRLTGAGVGSVVISSSLWTITVDVECRSNVLEEAACRRTFAKIQGSRPLYEMQGHACTLVPSACDVLRRIFESSLVLVFFMVFAAICQLTSAFFLYSYSYTTAHPKLREYSTVLTWLGPMILLVGLTVWSFLAPDLGEIPASLTNIAAMADVAGILGYHKVHDIQFGRSWFAAVALEICLIIQGIFWNTFFSESENEDEVIWEEVRQKQYIESLPYETYDGFKA